MVFYLLRIAPDTASLPTQIGKLAVHFSTCEGHLPITSALLWNYPESASMPSGKGKLPLHFCARWGYVDVAHELLGVYPDAVRALDWDGSLPLHEAAREGQHRMARYLIKRLPMALQVANLRGEIPLFSAVRSGNLDLVALMIQAWPMGGKYVLQGLTKDDNVHGLSSDILELLLRGAVNNLSGCRLFEGRQPPTIQLIDDVAPLAAMPAKLKANKKAKKDKTSKEPKLVDVPLRRMAVSATFHPPSTIACPEYSQTSTATATFGGSLPPRSKSLVLTSSCCSRLRNKWSRRESEIDESSVKGPTFVPMHAAFASAASIHVIERVLQENAHDSDKQDERGRYPLHYAVAHCRRDQDDIVQLLLSKPGTNNILNRQAATTQDGKGRLPLYLAIANHADVRIVKKLLELYPESGIKPCGTPDRFLAATPISMATYYNSDLSTVFELLRVDPGFVAKRYDL
jgi:ankyrin repeat protein